MRATSLIYAIVISSLVMSVFGLFISDVTSNYGLDYNNSDVELYNKLSSVQETAEALHTKINDTNQDTSLIDVVGGWITRAVDSIKLTFQSLSASNEMVETATRQIGLPQQFYTAITVLLLVFLVLGVIIRIMVKTPT